MFFAFLRHIILWQFIHYFILAQIAVCYVSMNLYLQIWLLLHFFQKFQIAQNLVSTSRKLQKKKYIYIYKILNIRYLLWEVMLIQFVNIYLISMRYYCFFYFNFCYRQILALFNEVKQTLMYGIIVFNTFHIYIIWHVIGITHNLIYGILIKINLAVLVQV